MGKTCGTSCSEWTDCRNCTNGGCMWCINLNSCIERNAYLASFPYGQCMDWTTDSKMHPCPAPPEGKHKNGKSYYMKNHNLYIFILLFVAETMGDEMCTGYRTCDECRSNPACGWCDDGSLTGLGSCMPGGASGPYRRQRRATTHSRGEWVRDDSMCPRDDGRGRAWHFTSCPSCQCHGHSNCSASDGGDVCALPCADHTEGDHCERCAEGYFGDAVNGGSCETCKCHGNAAKCDHKSGRCHCTTKGIVGDHCEKCDKVNHYYGDAVKTSCFCKFFCHLNTCSLSLDNFYLNSDELAIDYQFTFNLSKVDDRHFTAINFRNTPTKMDVDVDFTISCSLPAKVQYSISQQY